MIFFYTFVAIELRMIVLNNNNNNNNPNAKA